MGAEPESWNYFNYFTEIEEQFQRSRNTSLFLLSPLDWALIETWKDTGVPLEAVLRGIEAAFEKWRAKQKGQRLVNSLAYCAQAVQEEAQAIAGASASRQQKPAKAPFELQDLRAYFERNADALRDRAGFEEIIISLEKLTAELEIHFTDLESLEQRLSVLEERMTALARTRQTEQQQLQARKTLDASLRPYRGKMTADQLAMLERQYLERALLESAGLPRLSLFYLR